LTPEAEPDPKGVRPDADLDSEVCGGFQQARQTCTGTLQTVVFLFLWAGA